MNGHNCADSLPAYPSIMFWRLSQLSTKGRLQRGRRRWWVEWHWLYLHWIHY